MNGNRTLKSCNTVRVTREISVQQGEGVVTTNFKCSSVKSLTDSEYTF